MNKRIFVAIDAAYGVVVGIRPLPVPHTDNGIENPRGIANSCAGKPLPRAADAILQEKCALADQQGRPLNTWV
jgi:hypothetical protein